MLWVSALDPNIQRVLIYIVPAMCFSLFAFLMVVCDRYTFLGIIVVGAALLILAPYLRGVFARVFCSADMAASPHDRQVMLTLPIRASKLTVKEDADFDKENISRQKSKKLEADMVAIAAIAHARKEQEDVTSCDSDDPTNYDHLRIIRQRQKELERVVLKDRKAEQAADARDAERDRIRLALISQGKVLRGRANVKRLLSVDSNRLGVVQPIGFDIFQ